MHIASILEEQRRLNEALTYIKTSTKTFARLLGSEHEKTIIAMWAKTSIAYSLKDEKTEKYCQILFSFLKMRDQKIATSSMMENSATYLT